MNKPKIKKAQKLWVGGAVEKKPNLELVFLLAKERDIDGVVMCWGARGGASYATGSATPMWVYLIDVDLRQVYKEKATTKKGDVNELAERMFFKFVDARDSVTTE